MGQPPPISSAQRLSEICAIIAEKNADKLRYLEWRKVKRNFYFGNEAVREHFEAEVLIHAKEILEHEENEIAAESERQKEMTRQLEILVSWLKKQVEAGVSYLDFTDGARDQVEKLNLWISGEPIVKWSSWHLTTSRLIESIPDRIEILSRIRVDSNLNAKSVSWEYKTIAAKIEGAASGILSAFQDQGLDETAARHLETLGRQGWEVVSASPVVYGALASVSTPVLIIILKRQKNV